MNKKIQVFVSSTYTDLIEERQTVARAIFDYGYIPTGMELFEASKGQMKAMRKIIDESDIYILILGNNYDRLIEKESGLSYTELEYRYALSKNMPIFTLSLNNDFNPDTYYNRKISSYHDIDLPEDFRYLVFSGIVKFANSIPELYILTNHFLGRYDILVSYIKSQTPDLQISSLLTMFDYANINTILKYYFDLHENFKIQFIDDLTANKCIVDPLGNPISDISNIRIDVSEVNDWMLKKLNENPTDLYQLSSRRFEELIAEIFIRKGYNVELTPATRDGGKDIYVAHKNDFGSFLYVVECKKYNPNHKVGVNVLRDLYGILSKERATYGIAVTTSYFSKPAQEFQQDIQFQMSLHDFDSIKKWLCDVT